MMPYNQGGRILICDVNCNDLYTMSKKAFKFIKEAVDSGKYKPSDIVALSRNNQHLVITICSEGRHILQDGTGNASHEHNTLQG